jgi:hypothetical protein
MITSLKEFQINGRLKGTVIVFLGIALFVALAFWGNVPTQTNLGVFIAGILVLLFFIGLIGFVGWHLLVRPLPPGQKAAAGSPLPTIYRQLIAVLMAINGLFLIVGTFWDEVWHRQYGTPFGEDFFWRPHLLMYTGIIITVLLAFAGLLYMLRRGKGSLQQRFRANPTIGLLILMGAFLMYSLPADPIWHNIYGVDLTAWSIPHVILIFSFTAILLLGATIYHTTLPRREWHFRPRPRRTDFLPYFVMGLALNMLLQGMTTDWESTMPILRVRPDWLLAATIVSLAVFMGTLAAYSLRYAGAATLAGISGLLIRLLFQTGFNFFEVTPSAWIIVLFPMLTLDIGLALYGARQKRPSPWIITGLAATVGMAAAGYPLINQFYSHPQITTANLLIHLITTAIAACGAAWVGQTLGDILATANKQVEDIGVASANLRLVPSIALTAVLAFIVFFVATAVPPA